MKTDFIVIGAGVAGSVLSWLLERRGAEVLQVQAGPGASHAPAAVVNPIRAKRGKAVPAAREKLASAWRLYAQVSPLSRGLWLTPPPGRAPRFVAAASSAGLIHHLDGDRLFLPEAFWLFPRPLLARLGAKRRLTGRVVGLEAGRVHLEEGAELKGEVILAGGAEGAALGGVAGSLSAGSVLRVAEAGPAVIAEAFFAGGAIGGSYRPLRRFRTWTPTLGEVEELLAKGRHLLGHTPTLLGAHAGVRLRLKEKVVERPYGLFFGGFGSTGFLEAPYHAERLVGQL